MADLGSIPWPPVPIRTKRLLLREPEARDRAGFIDLLASPEVGTFIGGPRSRGELEQRAPPIPNGRPGLFVIEADQTFIGTVELKGADDHGQRSAFLRAGAIEIGYLFLPASWGRGLAVEACTAVLAWFGDVHPEEPVLLCTQVANERSVRLAERLGFVEVERFEEYDAGQWLGRRAAPAIRGLDSGQ